MWILFWCDDLIERNLSLSHTFPTPHLVNAAEDDCASSKRMPAVPVIDWHGYSKVVLLVEPELSNVSTNFSAPYPIIVSK